MDRQRDSYWKHAPVLFSFLFLFFSLLPPDTVWFALSLFPLLKLNKMLYVYALYANAWKVNCFKVLDSVYHHSICLSADLMQWVGKPLPKLQKSSKTETPHPYQMCIVLLLFLGLFQVYFSSTSSIHCMPRCKGAHGWEARLVARREITNRLVWQKPSSDLFTCSFATYVIHYCNVVPAFTLEPLFNLMFVLSFSQIVIFV